MSVALLRFTAVLAAAGIVFVFATSAVGSGERHSWTQPDTLRIGLQVAPNSLSPMLTNNDYEAFVNGLTFDQLVTTDRTGRHLLPVLATEVPTLKNGGISADGLTIRYRLRHNVRWQDGEPFTSRDVKFTHSIIANPANNLPNRSGWDVVKSVDTPDDYTVIFHMRKLYAPAIGMLFGDGDSSYLIVPEHLLARYPDINQVAFNQQPVGTGPFKVVRWSRGERIDLVANDDYFQGKPRLRKIAITFIPDETTLLTQLRTHEIDLAILLSPNVYGQVKTIPDVLTMLVDEHAVSALLINTTQRDLTDVHARRALAYAIDKQFIVDRFTNGASKVATADLPDFMWAFDPDVPQYGFQPDRAREELHLAGWSTDKDGMASREGRRLSLTLAYNAANAGQRLIGVQIQSYLRAIGVDVVLKSYPGAMLFGAASAGGIYKGGKFDLALYGMTAGIDPDSAARFTCAALAPAGKNYSRYCNQAMDQAQHEALSTFDESIRKRAYSKTQRLLARDVPLVFLYWPKTIYAFNSDMRGFMPSPVNATLNAYEWAI